MHGRHGSMSAPSCVASNWHLVVCMPPGQGALLCNKSEYTRSSPGLLLRFPKEKGDRRRTLFSLLILSHSFSLTQSLSSLPTTFISISLRPWLHPFCIISLSSPLCS